MDLKRTNRSPAYDRSKQSGANNRTGQPSADEETIAMRATPAVVTSRRHMRRDFWAA